MTLLPSSYKFRKKLAFYNETILTKGTTTMKQLLVIAIALASTNAFASRARVKSLGNSAHITDTQSIFSNPAKMFLMGDFVSLESGKTDTNNAAAAANPNDNAEGTLVRSMGDAKVGLALGHKSENASMFGLRSMLAATVAANSKFEQQNPIELSYGMKSGDMTWAATLVYSNYNDKKNEIKEDSAGVRLGLLMGAWDINVGIGLSSNVKDKLANGGAPATGVDFKGTGSYQVFAGYNMGSLYTYGDVTIAGAKMERQDTGAELANVDATRISIGAIESIKKDGNEFFYGAKLASFTQKNKTAPENKVTTLTLPVTVGLEAEATSWMTLRGSLTQTVLINNSKDETTPADPSDTEFAPGANNTVAAIGAGLKFNKITVDGTLEGLTGAAPSQDLSGDTLLTTVGLTYMF